MRDDPTTSMPAGFEHVAIAASRIRDLLPLYRGVLGGAFHMGGDNPELGYRAVQLRFADGGIVELLEPLEGSAFLTKFLRRGGGLHHLTFTVDDLQASIGRLTGPGGGPSGPAVVAASAAEAFLHPGTNHGVLVQLVERGSDRPSPGAGGSLADVLEGRGHRGNGVPSP